MGENAPKIVIVVLVIVVVVFFIGVGVGAGNNGKGGLPGITVDSVVNSFRGLIPAPAVTADEISASSSCFNAAQMRITVPTIGSCQFTVSDSDANVRALKLQINPGQRVHIESTTHPAGDNPMKATIDLKPGGDTETTLNFFKKNNNLTISNCNPGGGSFCTLTIVQ